jgi:hypothetical protein
VSSFGTRLRTQRERQQVALADIAEQSKIRVGLLEGLERDDVRQWPSGIFRRSYIRSYAQAIGLDPEPVVREFLDLYPDPCEDLAVLTPTPGPPPTRFRFLLGSALNALPRTRSHAAPADAPPQMSLRPVLDSADDTPSYVEQTLADDPTPPAPPHPAVSAVRDPLASPVDLASPAPPSGETSPVTEAVASPPRGQFLPALAHLCGELARARDAQALHAVLADAVALVDAVGLVVWMWDGHGGTLRPVLTQGYDEGRLAQLGGVPIDSDTALAAAFRARSARRVAGSGHRTGALVVPLPSPDGCPGVLAVELRAGAEADPDVNACAAILAAQLAMLVSVDAQAAGN